MHTFVCTNVGVNAGNYVPKFAYGSQRTIFQE